MLSLAFLYIQSQGRNQRKFLLLRDLILRIARTHQETDSNQLRYKETRCIYPLGSSRVPILLNCTEQHCLSDWPASLTYLVLPSVWSLLQSVGCCYPAPQHRSRWLSPQAGSLWCRVDCNAPYYWWWISVFLSAAFLKLYKTRRWGVHQDFVGTTARLLWR